MNINNAVNELVSSISRQLESEESETRYMGSHAERLHRIRESDDETYRMYISALLEQRLDEGGDYSASDGSVVYLMPSDKAMIVEQVFGSSRGLGLIGALMMDDRITTIIVNGPDRIFVEKDGRSTKLDARFCNDSDCRERERKERGRKKLRKIISRIADSCGVEVSERSPIASAELTDGTRIDIVLHPIAAKGDSVTIRRPKKAHMTAEEPMGYSYITEDIAEKLRLFVQAGYNIFVSGAPGSGKTAMLNVLADLIPYDKQVVLAEELPEIRLRNINDAIFLLTRKASQNDSQTVGMNELIESAINIRPDHMIAGDIRGKEAFTLINAANTGYSSIMSAISANSPEEMLMFLETMVSSGSDGLPLGEVRRRIGAALDIIIHVQKMRDGSRRVTEMIEIAGCENGELILNTLYLFEEDERSSDDHVSGKLKRTDAPLKKSKKLIQAGIWRSSGFDRGK